MLFSAFCRAADADGSNTSVIPLEVNIAPQEHLPDGIHLRDSLDNPDDREKVINPAHHLPKKPGKFNGFVSEL